MSSEATPKDRPPSDPKSTVPATKGDVASIFTAINAIADKVDSFKTSTTDLINGVNQRITTLEKDLADGSTTGDNQDNTTLGLSSLFKTNPSTLSTSVLSSPLRSSMSAKRHFLSDDDDNQSKPKKKKSKKKKKPTPSSSDSSSDSKQDHLDPFMQEIMQEYEVTKPKYLEDPTTASIQVPLATMLETWFWSVYSNEEVKNELCKTSRPANAPALIPTKINEAIFRSLSPQALTKDMPTRFIQNAFMKAAQPVSIVWDTLIQFENHLKATQTPMSHKFSDSLTVDFQLLRKHLDQALRLLGIANSQMVVHRKEILSQFLNKDFKKICKKHIAFDQWMFGSNLKTLLEDTARVNRLVQQNKPQPASPPPSKTTFFRRGRGQQTVQSNQRGKSQFARGRGYRRGWQVQSNIQNPPAHNKPGNPPGKQQTKRS